MEIKGKVHCFFEQSGTFKKETIQKMSESRKKFVENQKQKEMA